MIHIFITRFFVFSLEKCIELLVVVYLLVPSAKTQYAMPAMQMPAMPMPMPMPAIPMFPMMQPQHPSLMMAEVKFRKISIQGEDSDAEEKEEEDKIRKEIEEQAKREQEEAEKKEQEEKESRIDLNMSPVLMLMQPSMMAMPMAPAMGPPMPMPMPPLMPPPMAPPMPMPFPMPPPMPVLPPMGIGIIRPVTVTNENQRHLEQRLPEQMKGVTQLQGKPNELNFRGQERFGRRQYRKHFCNSNCRGRHFRNLS